VSGEGSQAQLETQNLPARRSEAKEGNLKLFTTGYNIIISFAKNLKTNGFK